LVNKRCYKAAWALEETLEFFKEMSGVKFDPALVNLLLTCQDDLMAIQNKYKDTIYDQ